MRINSNPAYEAYHQLTFVSSFVKHLETGSKFGNMTMEEFNSRMDFDEFQNTLQGNKVVNKDLSRETSSFHNKLLRDRLSFGGNTSYEAEVSEAISRAFKLGLVGSNEQLIAKYRNSI